MSTGKRLAYPDFLRVIASFFVVVIHVSCVGLMYYDVGSSVWLWSTAINSVCHWAVPAFFMISGMFLLDPQKKFDTKAFFKKNVVRIAAAALIFGFLYACLDRVLFGDFSLKSAAIVVYYTVFGKAGYHLWYLFALLVLYVFTPALRVFTTNASKKELDCALILWFVFFIVFGQIDLLAEEIAGIEELMPFPQAKLMGYAGYYLLGYRLKVYPFEKKTLAWICVGAAAALVVLPAATIYFGQVKETPEVDAFIDQLGVGSCLIAAALFSLASRMRIGERAGKVLRFVGSHTFGIYLWHVLFVTLFFHILSFRLDVLPPLALIGYSAAVYLCAFAVTALMKLIPGLKKLI